MGEINKLKFNCDISANKFIGNLSGTATNATNAEYAVNATSAEHATNATNATNAANAEHATNATNAVNDENGNNIVSSYSKADHTHPQAYTYGTEDLVAGESPLETGKLYFVYE